MIEIALWKSGITIQNNTILLLPVKMRQYLRVDALTTQACDLCSWLNRVRSISMPTMKVTRQHLQMSCGIFRPAAVIIFFFCRLQSTAIRQWKIQTSTRDHDELGQLERSSGNLATIPSTFSHSTQRNAHITTPGVMLVVNASGSLGVSFNNTRLRIKRKSAGGRWCC